MRMFKSMSAVFFLLTFAQSSLVQADTIFVDADADPGGNGRSWQTAFDDLQDALAAAQAGDDIWVAEGTYTPAPPNGKRKATFQLISGVGIYGGFVGKEQRREERDPQAQVTILSGDLNGDDGPNFQNNDENSYHVVTGGKTDATTVLDGFTITAGNADMNPNPHGGGMYNRRGRPLVANCTFAGNSASWRGGGLYIAGGHITLTNCTFTRNSSYEGGGVYVIFNAKNATLIDCTFRQNTASYRGGGMMITKQAQATLTGCAFIGNVARDFHGGGLGLSAPRRVLITNCVFAGNVAERDGGAIWLDEVIDRVDFTTCTFTQNTAKTGRGGGVHYLEDHARDLRLSDSIFWENRDANGMVESSQIYFDPNMPVINYSCVQGWTGKMGGEGNIGDDPKFVDPENGNFRLGSGSPAIDAADSDTVPDGVETDLDGNPRFLDDPDTENTGRGPGCPVDMGAYEFQDGECQCTAKEKLKAKCRGGKGKNKIKATLKKAEPQATVTFRLDGDPDTDIRKTVSNGGKAKAKFRRVPDGEHTVEIVECGVRKMMECP